jgi:hypothetical protein
MVMDSHLIRTDDQDSYGQGLMEHNGSSENGFSWLWILFVTDNYRINWKCIALGEGIPWKTDNF